MQVVEIKKWQIVLSLVLFLLIIVLMLNPKVYMQSTLKGFIVWATAVLPALFPFFFLTKLLSSLKLIESLSTFFKPITTKLFNVSGVSSYVFLMSIISGYPVGAKLTSELYASGVITKSEAARMCSFCSTSGPLFIIGTVGVGMFLSKSAGLAMLLCHILGAFINGILYRNYGKKEKIYTKEKNFSTEKNIDNILATTIYDSIISILIIGGYIALFFMFIDVLTNFHILGFFSNIFEYVLGVFGLDISAGTGLASGIVEVTRGCLDLSQSTASLPLLIVLGTGLISWGGLSIHFQAITFLQKCKIKMGVYFLQKFTHCVISMILATLYVVLFL